MNPADFRHGRYQDVLQDVNCDALIADPPYSKRTHVGRRTGSEVRQSSIDYDHLTEEQVTEIAEFWHTRTRRWAILSCDHETWGLHEAAWAKVGWYTFHPIPWCKPDAAPRMSGDGPASGVEWLMVARPKHVERGGSRPPFYIESTASTRGNGGVPGFPGAKPVQLMRRIICDYTEHGQTVCDPFSGTGTTGVAARREGRLFVGCEMRREVYEAAAERLSKPQQVALFSPPIVAVQSSLLEK